MDRLLLHGLRLNPDKIKIKICTAPFMGHTLAPEGLKPSSEIANAVLSMPQPHDKAATRGFKGTINYICQSFVLALVMLSSSFLGPHPSESGVSVGSPTNRSFLTSKGASLSSTLPSLF